MNDPLPHQEWLLAAYQGQRAEAAQHRQNIFNAFTFSMAVLLAIAAGVVAPGHLAAQLKCMIALVTLIWWASILIFIKSQRMQSDKAMRVMRTIGHYLKLGESGALIPDATVLPPGAARKRRLSKGEKT